MPDRIRMREISVKPPSKARSCSVLCVSSSSKVPAHRYLTQHAIRRRRLCSLQSPRLDHPPPDVARQFLRPVLLRGGHEHLAARRRDRSSSGRKPLRRFTSSSPMTSSMSSTGAEPWRPVRYSAWAIFRAMARVRFWPSLPNCAADRSFSSSSQVVAMRPDEGGCDRTARARGTGPVPRRNPVSRWAGIRCAAPRRRGDAPVGQPGQGRQLGDQLAAEPDDLVAELAPVRGRSSPAAIGPAPGCLSRALRERRARA